ncbi:MAG: phenylalanine--tRNA ligase subunit alpha [Defluviitaleaceae bacterium]|nr:phenylalanine--tRNA ligase subunit alpha [Defluviitaleaceae bacterium]
MNLNEKPTPILDKILTAGEMRISAASSLAELQEIKASIVGKHGTLTEVLKEIPKMEPALRAEIGRAANQLKAHFIEILDARAEEIQLKASEISPDFDLTVPGFAPPMGGLHPITQMCYDLNDAFRSMGFEIFTEADISSELYAFDNLNFPPEHPARESMDTFWLEGHDKGDGGKRLCLRPHLTGASVRFMQTHKPPFRFVYPGRVYRNEATDARHERAFFQYEALIVDREFKFSAGMVMIKSILSKVFGRDIPVRMRVGFFPFVEPGFEIDMMCLVCDGKGCSVCKHVGWLEIMPGGSPHPNVLRAAGLEPSEYAGFYVNIGLDRLVMMRYGVDDVRLFHSADLRFLNQFA